MKANFNVGAFETISETSEQKLIGGFSTSFKFKLVGALTSEGTTNNCQGGNCTDLCGSGQNIKCNSVVGCNS